jgi:hypothetical protein
MHSSILLARAAARHSGGRLSGKGFVRLTRWTCLVLCLLLLAPGCGGRRRSVDHADVSGKVTYNGKPVTGGEITFVTAEGFASTGIIDPEGNYTIKAPVGPVKVSVNNQMIVTAAAGGKVLAKQKGGSAARPGAPEATPIKGKFMPLPPKYLKMDTTDLTYTVTSGSQTKDFDLKD